MCELWFKRFAEASLESTVRRPGSTAAAAAAARMRCWFRAGVISDQSLTLAEGSNTGPQVSMVLGAARYKLITTAAAVGHCLHLRPSSVAVSMIYEYITLPHGRSRTAYV